MAVAAAQDESFARKARVTLNASASWISFCLPFRYPWAYGASLGALNANARVVRKALATSLAWLCFCRPLHPPWA